MAVEYLDLADDVAIASIRTAERMGCAGAMTVRIAVFGTGATGSSVAADLVVAGHNVVLIDQWPEHVEAMRERGLRVCMPDRELHVPVDVVHLCEARTLHDPFDVVFLATKAYDTPWAAEFIRPHLKADGLLVGLQNGMTLDTVANAVGVSRTIGCVVELSSEIFTPGLVKRNTPPERTWFALGSVDGTTDSRVPEIAAIVGDVGTVAISSEIVSAKWTKLVVNAMCLGPVAILGMGIPEGARIPDMREWFLQIGREALAVGPTLGYRIQPLFGLEPEDLDRPDGGLDALLSKLAGDIGDTSDRNCVLQDHLKGRYSEVDSINGLVLGAASRLGYPAPANAMVVELTRQIFSGHLRPDRANLDLVRSIRSR